MQQASARSFFAMMTRTMTSIHEFLAFRRFAIVGASNDARKYGHIVYHNLKDKGFRVFAVNPKVDDINGETCYASLAELPEPVDGVVIIVPPAATEKVVRDVAEAGIPRVWMQPGAESEEAIRFCEENDISVVHHACIMTLT
jgi:predicted CoA-binding protein